MIQQSQPQTSRKTTAMCRKQLTCNGGHRETTSSTAQEQEPFHRPLKQRRAKSNLQKRSRVLDRRYVTDQCHSVVAGPLQARPILIQAQATLISLPSNHTEERIIRKQDGTMPTHTCTYDACDPLVTITPRCSNIIASGSRTHTRMRRMRSVCKHHSKMLQHRRIRIAHTHAHTTHAIRL